MNFLTRFFWKKTTADLSDELRSGRRRQITAAEIELAKAYERRHMPADIRYPRAGEVYEANDDFAIQYLTSYRAPYTGGGSSVLPKGEHVRVCELSDPEPIGVACVPINYDLLHERIIPAEERASPKYAGYHFHIETIDLNRRFRLIESPKSNDQKHVG